MNSKPLPTFIAFRPNLDQAVKQGLDQLKVPVAVAFHFRKVKEIEAKQQGRVYGAVQAVITFAMKW